MPVNWKSTYRLSRPTCKAVQDFPSAACVVQCATLLSPHLFKASLSSSLRFIPPYSIHQECSLAISSILCKHLLMLIGHRALQSAQFSHFNVNLAFQLFSFTLYFIPVLVKAGSPSILVAFLFSYSLTLFILTCLSSTLSHVFKSKIIFFPLSSK